jgi:hypothetical protein
MNQFDQLQRLSAQLHRASSLAERTNAAPELRAELNAREKLCGELLGSPPTRAPLCQGYLNYTLDDESYQPHGRQLDVRLGFNWNDYDPHDDPGATWGAVIESVEVLAVRYFDYQGNVVNSHDHLQGVARQLWERNEDEIREACTQEGVRLGIGRAHPFYRPAFNRMSATNPAGSPRMAPSARTRQAAPVVGKLG